MESTKVENRSTGYRECSRIGRRERYTIISAAASAVTFVVLFVSVGKDTAVIFGALLAFVPLFTYLQLRERQFKCTPEMILNEAPSVIGMMSVTLSSNGSFDSAVRYVANNGPKNISAMFKSILMDADCRAIPDIKTSLFDMISRFPKELSPFRRAMHIAATAFESADENERTAMMKDAENIVIEGLRTVGNTYSSKLSTPCMIVFGLGIMVPMILISVLPMLSMGGQFAVSGLDPDVCEFIILVVIPAIVGVVILSLKGKNPFFEIDDFRSDIRFLFPLLTAAPAYWLMQRNGVSSERAFVIAAVIGCGLSMILMMQTLAEERKRTKTEGMLKDVLFELGNRLSMRENFDTALLRSLGTRKDCIWVFENISRELAICRGDVESAICSVIGKVSKNMAALYCEIYKASVRDIRDAGKLATGIAHQLQDQNNVRKDIENKLRSMLDMMSGTAAIFAPLILGMSVVMLGPISNITGAVFFDDISRTLMIYLVELSALIAVLSSNLMCKGRLIDILCRFCISAPVALIVFTLCTMITI